MHQVLVRCLGSLVWLQLRVATAVWGPATLDCVMVCGLRGALNRGVYKGEGRRGYSERALVLGTVAFSLVPAACGRMTLLRCARHRRSGHVRRCLLVYIPRPFLAVGVL